MSCGITTVQKLKSAVVTSVAYNIPPQKLILGHPQRVTMAFDKRVNQEPMNDNCKLNKGHPDLLGDTALDNPESLAGHMLACLIPCQETTSDSQDNTRIAKD